MSLDLSPDGRTIVFDLLGDLYTLSITGGHARRLTSGMAFNRQPRYSPDGRQLVFVSDRSGSANVWVADRNGRNARRLSNLQGYPYGAVTSPAWSPDGRTIIVSQMVGATRPGLVGPSRLLRWLLAAYDVETGHMRWVSDTAPNRARSALGPTFSLDGSEIYAAIDAFRDDTWNGLQYWRIARVELATGRTQSELGVGQVGQIGMRPAFSPNGRYLAYVTRSGSLMGFRLRDLRTDRERWLVCEVVDEPPLNPDVDSGDLIPGYAFTPDSKALIAAYGGKIHRIDLATGRTAVVPFIAHVERGLGALRVHQFALVDTAVPTRSVMQPALSPDGRWVAFSAFDRIWVMELPRDDQPTSRPRRLTVDSVGEFYPSWSPDGRWIAYSTWRDGVGGGVRRAQTLSDAAERQIPSEPLTKDTALYFNIAVAPQGDRIVAVRAELPPDRVLTGVDSLKLALVWLPAAGGIPHTAASLATEQHIGFRDQYPVAQLYFTADPTELYVGLRSWRWDGTKPRAALTVNGSENSGRLDEATGVLSPDGLRAVITRRYALFELTLPSPPAGKAGTVDLRPAQTEAFGAGAGAARRWGTALAPWISWSRDGRRVLFSQGGTLFVGEVRPGTWTTFTQVDVPLMGPVDVPSGTLVLRGGRLITMRGNEVIERGNLVVRNNRILAVGAVGKVGIPPGARVLDVTGKTVLPGYVDLHDHMWLPRGIHPQKCWQCLARLAYGITAARDPQPMFAVDVFTYRERERAGDLLGPRVFSTGMAYFGSDPPIRTLDDARDAVRPNAEYFGSESFKIHYDPSAGRRTRQLLAMAAAEQGLNATVHGQTAELDATVIIDGFPGIEHPYPIRTYADVATLIGRSGTTHTQTYGAYFGWQYMLRRYGSPWEVAKMRRFAPPSRRAYTCAICASDWYGAPELDVLIPILAGAARTVARGGRVGIGSHGDIPGLGYHYEMWLHALGGMPAHEILRSATIVGAAALGHSSDFGSLEPGKLADFQVLDRNPLEDIHHTVDIRYVMKNGRLYKAENLTETWPRQLSPVPAISRAPVNGLSTPPKR